MKTNLKAYYISLMVMFLCLSFMLPVSFAASSIIFASHYVMLPEEIARAMTLAEFIANCSRSSGFTAYNLAGEYTIRENMYLAAQGNGHSYSIVFHTGHGNIDVNYYSGEWYWFVYDSYGMYVYDMDIFEYSNGNVRFVLLSSCFQGDVIGGTYESGVPYGMPYAWLRTTALSEDGYANASNTRRAFIGFKGVSPLLHYNLGGVNEALYNFLINFYREALVNGKSINYALDCAARAVWASCTSFSDCILRTGYTIISSGRMVVYGDGNMKIGPTLAMKTLTDGYFYVPSVATDLLKIEKLFDNSNLVGDQTGGTSPYATIANYPDGEVDMLDLWFVAVKFGRNEGHPEFDYMADVVPDRTIDMLDAWYVSKNYGKIGNYPSLNLIGVTVKFYNSGGIIEEKWPDSYGFVIIPQGATNFNVTRSGTPIGAMIIFW